MKGRIVDFDGLTFHLAPDGNGAPIAVRLLPGTSFGTQEPRTLAAFKTGAYAGATGTPAPDGGLIATEAHLYPETLRGSGEGRLPADNGRIVVNGTVVAAGEEGFTLSYRGAAMQDGRCSGRADPLGGSACSGTVHIAVAPRVPVTALVFADRRLLMAGDRAIVSLLTAPDGTRTTPGLILEKPTASP